MTYELAKQLKEAGFPQRFSSGYAFDEQGQIIQVVTDSDWTVKANYISIPNLKELIKQCREAFGGLEYLPNEITDKFRAYNQPIATLSIYADTPENAVTKLWLALKEKALIKPEVLEPAITYHPRRAPTAEELAADLIRQYYAHEKWERERHKDTHTELCRIKCTLEYLMGSYGN
jgi:hypothetical protein